MKAFYCDGNDVRPDMLVDGLEAVRCNLKSRLSIVLGELMTNTNFGIPLGASKDETDLHIQRIVLGTDGVVGLLTFSSKVDGKKYICQFEAETLYGRLRYE